MMMKLMLVSYSDKGKKILQKLFPYASLFEYGQPFFFSQNPVSRSLYNPYKVCIVCFHKYLFYLCTHPLMHPF